MLTPRVRSTTLPKMVTLAPALACWGDFARFLQRKELIHYAPMVSRRRCYL